MVENKRYSEQEAKELLEVASTCAEPISNLTKINFEEWNKEFKDNFQVVTPLGKLTIGSHQVYKNGRKGRDEYWKMLKPTITKPTFIIQELDTDGQPLNNYNYIKVFSTDIDDKAKWYIAISKYINGHGEFEYSSRRLKENEVIKRIKNNLTVYVSDDLRQAFSETRRQTATSLNSNITIKEEEVNSNTKF